MGILSETETRAGECMTIDISTNEIWEFLEKTRVINDLNNMY